MLFKNLRDQIVLVILVTLAISGIVFMLLLATGVEIFD